MSPLSEWFKGLYIAPKPYPIAWMERFEYHFLIIALMRDIFYTTLMNDRYILHDKDEW